ncbi:MAG: hypothetical protein P4N24_03350 [Acidobacteriota bacterium]|nr:hypothetical protein [Acidobacteriota bacterium]
MNLSFKTLLIVLLLVPVGVANQGSSGRPLARLDPRGRELLTQAMSVIDSHFDERAALIRPITALTPAVGAGYRHPHVIRDTSWYAVGLLLRDQPGDRDRAIRALNAVLDQQIDEPGERWHGTFYREAEEPRPGEGAREGHEYDANWREFIGTTLEIILLNFGDRLPKDLNQRMEQSIRTAVEGEISEARLAPSYTNIALLYGALISFAGERFHRADWKQRAAEWTTAVYRQFKEHGAFPEFNSQTYCGTDLFALALWRAYGTTPEMRRAGAEMEATLWRTIASLYHADLKNLSGPYDRSYGMDMRQYASLIGLWLRTVLDPQIAPLPAIAPGVTWGNEQIYAPTFLLVPTRIPEDAMRHFRAFQGERLVRQEITSKRYATAWIGKDYMFGGEFTSMTRDTIGPENQFHPVTLHWKVPGGDVGWIRMVNSPRVDAIASKDELKISCVGDSTFRIMARGAETSGIQRDAWVLPGLTVLVETDAHDASVAATQGYIEITYHDATRVTLRPKATR